MNVFTTEVAALALRLYEEKEGNYSVVLRGLNEAGYLDVSYRRVYRFFESQELPARGVARPKITIDNYTNEIVDAYYF